MCELQWQRCTKSRYTKLEHYALVIVAPCKAGYYYDERLKTTRCAAQPSVRLDHEDRVPFEPVDHEHCPACWGPFDFDADGPFVLGGPLISIIERGIEQYLTEGYTATLIETWKEMSFIVEIRVVGKNWGQIHSQTVEFLQETDCAQCQLPQDPRSIPITSSRTNTN